MARINVGHIMHTEERTWLDSGLVMPSMFGERNTIIHRLFVLLFSVSVSPKSK